MPPILLISAAELIAATHLTQGSPERRRWAIENTLAEMVGRPVDLGELRMSKPSRDELFAWIGEGT